MNVARLVKPVVVSSIVLAALLLTPPAARAHCDTLSGPVVRDARLALAKGNVTPVLKWVKPEAEAEIRTAFRKTIAARVTGGEAQDVADTWFFETLVRVHRAGEGAPFTGLKPGGSDLPHLVVAADRALDGEVAPDELASHLASLVAAGVKARLSAAAAKLRNAGTSVADGRAFVEAYVDYVHYVEALANLASGSPSHTKHGETER